MDSMNDWVGIPRQRDVASPMSDLLAVQMLAVHGLVRPAPDQQSVFENVAGAEV